MTKIGYARVSTTDQDLDVQHEKLKEQGCDIVRSEKVSGASRDGRQELKTVIDFLRPDDEPPDRLQSLRNFRHVRRPDPQ